MDAETCAEISARIEASRHAIREGDCLLAMPEGAKQDERLQELRARFADLSTLERLVRLGVELVGTEMVLVARRVRLRIAEAAG